MVELVGRIPDMPQSGLNVYYVIIALGAIYTLFKFGFNKISVFAVMVSWSGLFAYLDYINIIDFSFYRLIVPVYAISISYRSLTSIRNNTDKIILYTYILFLIIYWTSFFLNSQPILSTGSQFFYRYSIAFLFYRIISNFNNSEYEYTAKLFLHIVKLQVLFSVFKVVAIGGIAEPIVGSISFQGGGQAVVLPTLGFILYYLNNQGKLKGNQWLYVLSLFLISFVSAKRQPIIMYPLSIIFVYIHLGRTIKYRQLFKYIPLALLIFYIGVRTNYTLNPERTAWGSFDLNYMTEYIVHYQFGVQDIREIQRDYTIGRAGSIFLLFAPDKFNFESTANLLFGIGIGTFVTRSQRGVSRLLGDAYGVDHDGLASEAVQTVLILGYLGFISYLIYSVAIVFIVRNSKLRIILMLYLLYHILFYADVILGNATMSVLLVFICMYSNKILITDTGNNKNIGLTTNNNSLTSSRLSV